MSVIRTLASTENPLRGNQGSTVSGGGLVAMRREGGKKARHPRWGVSRKAGIGGDYGPA
jgi:hypothetical protein